MHPNHPSLCPIHKVKLVPRYDRRICPVANCDIAQVKPGSLPASTDTRRLRAEAHTLFDTVIERGFIKEEALRDQLQRATGQRSFAMLEADSLQFVKKHLATFLEKHSA